MKEDPRLRAGIWTLVVVLLLGVLACHLLRGIALQSSVLALLPPAEKNPVAEKVLSKFTHRAGQHLFFLVGHDNSQKSTELTRTFAGLLRESGVFFKVDAELGSMEDELYNLYFPYRFGLASPAVRAVLDAKQTPTEFFASTTKLLYLPMSGFYTQFLEKDPLLLFPRFLEELLPSRGELSLEDGILSAVRNQTHYGLVVAQFSGDPFTADVQDRVLKAVAAAEAKLLKQDSAAVLRFTGITRFAQAGAANMQSEMSLIGFGSLVGILLLLLFTFRSIGYFFLALTPIGVGLLAAVSLSLSMFEQVHLVTLGFGASLIGVCIDYTFHYLCDANLNPCPTRLSALRRLLPAISLGLFTSCIGYVCLGLPPFPGLRQMSFFSVVGLVSAFATVVCWFPYLVKPRPALRQSAMFEIASLLTRAAQSRQGQIVLQVSAIIVLFVGAYWASTLSANDDIRLLQDAPAELVENDMFVRTLVGRNDWIRFFIVEGANHQEVLERQEELGKELRGLKERSGLAAFQTMATVVPSIRSQKSMRSRLAGMLTSQGEAFENYVSQIGLYKDSITSFRKGLSSKADFLTPELWLAHNGSAPFRHLAIQRSLHGYVGLVFLSGVRDESSLRDIADRLERVSFVNKVSSISNVLKKYREQASNMVVLSYSFIILLFVVRFRQVSVVRLLMPPILAAVATLGLFGYMGVSVSLFHLIALLLVLGIGIDYSIFFAEHRSAPESTMLAVLLSAFTTVLSFGLLSLSETGVLHFIGTTVLIGISFALVFSPLALDVNRAGVDKTGVGKE